jgi:hypothetical protein
LLTKEFAKWWPLSPRQQLAEAAAYQPPSPWGTLLTGGQHSRFGRGQRQARRQSCKQPAGVSARLWEIGDIVNMIEAWEAARRSHVVAA